MREFRFTARGPLTYLQENSSRTPASSSRNARVAMATLPTLTPLMQVAAAARFV